MWRPEPAWERLPGGTAASTLGVWSTVVGGRRMVVKRLVPPSPSEPAELALPSHPAYWRREADVLAGGLATELPGVRAAPATVIEDDEGVTISQSWLDDAAPAPELVAGALGRLAGASVPETPVLVRGLLRARLDRVAARGGWPTLARTAVADAADHLWRRRAGWLRRLDTLPQVVTHGDATPTNLRGRDGDDVVALDWGTLGVAAVGSDLGYYALSSGLRAEAASGALLDAHLAQVPPRVGASRDDVLLGARVTAVYTALSRAEWALARVAPTGGAVTGTLVPAAAAPYLRSVQRQAESIAALRCGPA